MATQKPTSADGKLLVLLPGLGAVSTTFMAGVELARKGRAAPVGSLTQLGRLPGHQRYLREELPLAGLDDLDFAAWDLHGEDAATVARRSDVLSAEHYEHCRDLLGSIKPMPAAHDKNIVRRLEATDVIGSEHRREQAEELRHNIRAALEESGAERATCVMVTSTEVSQTPGQAHASVAAFEKALDANDPAVTPSQLYAYACLRERVPFANGTPNLALDLPVFQELANEMGVPVAGKDLKTGQTLLKTTLAPALQARYLGLSGWFSTNILGNRDGEVLDDRDAFRSKETTKAGVLDTILDREAYPELYGDIHHKVEINYYRPRGDNKEGWDNIDVFGWLGYPMQIKINFLCRDSILAAPLVLDIALLMDLAQRSGMRGTQDWMGFFFKAPMAHAGERVVHDLFAQRDALMRVLAELA